MNLCTVKPSNFFLSSISSSYPASNPQENTSEISAVQTDNSLPSHSSSKISSINPRNTTVNLTDNSKLIPACSMQLYNFPAPYLYAPYFGIYLQDLQNRIDWHSETPNLHSTSSNLSYLPLNQLPAVSLPGIHQWDLAAQFKKPVDARPGFISEMAMDTIRETTGKATPHVYTTQWLLSNQSSPSTGSPNAKYSKSTAPLHSQGADPGNGSATFNSSNCPLNPDVFQPIPPKENPTGYRKIYGGISQSPVMGNLAAHSTIGISAQRPLSSSPPSSPFVKQTSFWPRTQEFLEEVERIESQPRKRPSWEHMDLHRFYYPKINPDRLPYANTLSTSPSSTATPLSNTSSSKFSGPQIGKAWNGEYVFMDFRHITHQAPEIPRAIPAPYSFNDGRGTLDRILDNPHSTTNVYIRGFHPNTTDAMIQQYGSRFGEIETAKSIIDHLTDTCKGYGFLICFLFLIFFIGYPLVTNPLRTCANWCIGMDSSSTTISWMPRIVYVDFILEVMRQSSPRLVPSPSNI